MRPLVILFGLLLGRAGSAEARELAPDDVVRLALAAAPSLEAERASTRQAKRDLGYAAVDFVPTLEAQASYTRLSPVDIPPLSFNGIEIDNPFLPILDNTQVQLSATWPVSDLFFSILPAYRAQRDALHLQRATESVERTQVAKTALEAYYGLARVREGIAVAADGVAVLEAHERRLEDLFGAGLATRADVLAVSAQLAEAKGQWVSLQGTERVALAQLRSLLDTRDDIDVVVAEAPSAEPTSGEALVSQALDARPEMQLFDHLVDLHHHTAAAQRGAAAPHLVVGANYLLANPNQRILPLTEEFRGTWDVTVALQWSPNATVRGVKAAEQAATDEARARADRRAMTLGIEVQVLQARSQLEAAAETIAVTERRVTAAEAAFATELDLLAAGLSTPADSLDAEAAARRAQHALVDARIDLLVASVQLQHATGHLLDPTEPQP